MAVRQQQLRKLDGLELVGQQRGKTPDEQIEGLGHFIVGPSRDWALHPSKTLPQRAGDWFLQVLNPPAVPAGGTAAFRSHARSKARHDRTLRIGCRICLTCHRLPSKIMSWINEDGRVTSGRSRDGQKKARWLRRTGHRMRSGAPTAYAQGYPPPVGKTAEGRRRSECAPEGLRWADNRRRTGRNFNGLR